MFSILFFKIIIIEKLYVIQHLLLVYYFLLCHFQPALSIGTRLILNYFLRVCFRTTLMLTYSEHYVNNVLPGLEIYKYIWCELYTPLLILIASNCYSFSFLSHKCQHVIVAGMKHFQIFTMARIVCCDINMHLSFAVHNQSCVY